MDDKQLRADPYAQEALRTVVALLTVGAECRGREADDYSVPPETAELARQQFDRAAHGPLGPRILVMTCGLLIDQLEKVAEGTGQSLEELIRAYALRVENVIAAQTSG